MTHMKIHMHLMEQWDEFQPKHHVIFHPLQETMEKGNPWFYSAWLDESLNKILKAASGNASNLQFDRTVLLRMKELMKSRTGIKRRAED